MAGVSFDGAGGSSGGGGAELADGVYWYDGDAFTANIPPLTGQGWTLTTLVSDGVSGDTGTRVTSTGANISIMHKGSAFDLAAWDATFKWKGGFSSQFAEWDGSAWDAVASISPGPLPHGAYTDEQIAALPNGAASLTIHMIVATSDDISGSAFMSCSDSRPS